MEKMKLDNNSFVYPMPMVIVGTVVDDKENFMPAGWVARVNFKPPMIAISLGSHYTNKGIEEHKSFSVNIPGAALMEKTDYCGLISGKNADKSKLFDTFYGETENTPLIKECPLCMCCSVCEIVRLPTNTIYIGEIVETFVDSCCITDGKPDIKKIDPFTLSMPDNNYWKVGEFAGKAWSAGKVLK